jgi:hypothetical protein
LTNALAADIKLSAEAEKEEQTVHKAEENLEDPESATKRAEQDPSTGGKLIVKEEIVEGRVEWSACKLHYGHSCRKLKVIF